MVILAASITNALDGSHVVYSGSGIQSLVLAVTNVGPQALELTARSKLALRLHGFASVMVTPPTGWTVRATDDGWSVRCDDETAASLKHGEAISIGLGGLDPATVQGSAMLEADHHGIADEPGTLIVPIPIETRPPEGLVDLALNLQVHDVAHRQQVLITPPDTFPVRNDLIVVVGNPGDRPLLKDQPADGACGYLTLEAMIAADDDDIGGLARLDDLRLAVAGVAEANRTHWTADPANPIVENDQWIRWKFIPTAPILAGHESISLSLGGLVTGVAGGTTQLVLRHHDLPGYRNGAAVCTLLRCFPAIEIIFTGAPQDIALGDAVDFYWHNFGPASVVLDGPDLHERFEDERRLYMPHYPVTPARPGEHRYTLTPLGDDGVLRDERGNPVRAQDVTITVQAPPATIDSIALDRRVVEPGGQTTLTWSTSRAAKVALKLVGGQSDASEQPDAKPHDTLTIGKISGTIDCELTVWPECFGQDRQRTPPASRTVRVQSLDARVRDTRYVFQPPSRGSQTIVASITLSGDNSCRYSGTLSDIVFRGAGAAPLRRAPVDRPPQRVAASTVDLAGTWTVEGFNVVLDLAGSQRLTFAWTEAGLTGHGITFDGIDGSRFRDNSAVAVSGTFHKSR